MAMRCPACDAADLVLCADLGEVPALCGVTWSTPADATGSPAGPMRLEHCPACAHVVNVAYRPELVEYDGSYDNSLHYSPTFQAYATELAKRLSSDYRLAGQSVLELGCGKGDFLQELCRVAGCRGTGYDASYEGPTGQNGDVEFVPGFLPLDGSHPADLRPDFLVTRHVLEHLTDPYEFLVGLRRLVGDRESGGYFEVPNAGYDFATAGWDCIYPHVCYFNAESLRAMVSRAGFDVLRVDTSFSDIFLYVEVGTGRRRPTAAPTGQVAADQLAQLASFADRYAGTVARWRATIAELAAEGANPVLWGAGARGVAFLNAADPDRTLAGVVDVNPHKWGRFLPVTGHRVTAPRQIAALDPRAVIITNPAYHQEIGRQLVDLGVGAQLLTA